MSAEEEPLLGGIQPGRVTRVGDTVRRPSGPWTPTIFALLEHLRAKGFPAPRPLGLDRSGREMLSWVPGRACNWPWPAALLATSGAREIGAFVRAYHVAVAEFAPPSPVIRRQGPQDLRPDEVVLHGISHRTTSFGANPRPPA